jgi:hypothetical protein
MTSKDNLWEIADALNDVPHSDLVSRSQLKGLRKADATERRAGSIVQWEKPISPTTGR